MEPTTYTEDDVLFMKARIDEIVDRALPHGKTENTNSIQMDCQHYHYDTRDGEWCDIHDVCNYSICRDRTDVPKPEPKPTPKPQTRQKQPATR